jgi:hypothetical protein
MKPLLLLTALAATLLPHPARADWLTEQVPPFDRAAAESLEHDLHGVDLAGRACYVSVQTWDFFPEEDVVAWHYDFTISSEATPALRTAKNSWRGSLGSPEQFRPAGQSLLRLVTVNGMNAADPALYEVTGEIAAERLVRLTVRRLDDGLDGRAARDCRLGAY